MLKKFSIMLIVVLLAFFTVGCNITKYIKVEKPSTFYYTKHLNNLVKEQDFKMQILDTNVYHEKTVDQEDNPIILDMINSLKDEYFFKERPNDLPKKSLYKIFIEKNKLKMVIDVYGSDLISIYPWDGTYEKDFIDLSDVPNAFKMEQFCKYIFNK